MQNESIKRKWEPENREEPEYWLSSTEHEFPHNTVQHEPSIRDEDGIEQGPGFVFYFKNLPNRVKFVSRTLLEDIRIKKVKKGGQWERQNHVSVDGTIYDGFARIEEIIDLSDDFEPVERKKQRIEPVEPEKEPVDREERKTEPVDREERKTEPVKQRIESVEPEKEQVKREIEPVERDLIQINLPDRPRDEEEPERQEEPELIYVKEPRSSSSRQTSDRQINDRMKRLKYYNIPMEKPSGRLGLPDLPQLDLSGVYTAYLPDLPDMMMEEDPRIPDNLFSLLESFSEHHQDNSFLDNQLLATPPQPLIEVPLTDALQLQLYRHRFELTKQAERNVKNLKIAVPTSDFNIRLFPSVQSCLKTTPFDHQKQGSRWMYLREQGNYNLAPYLQPFNHNGMNLVYNAIEERFYTSSSTFKDIKGGILADDMGLGKTIQVLLLILLNSPVGKFYQGDSDNEQKEKVRVDDKNSRAERTTTSSFHLIRTSLSEGVNQQDQKSRALREVCSHRDYDKYNIEMLKEFSRILRLPTVGQKAQLITNLNQVANEQLAPEGNNVSPTLLVCPLGVMEGWIDQVKTHLYPNSLKVYKFYKENRNITPEQLCDYDFVVTNYHTLLADFSEFQVKSSMMSHLLSEHQQNLDREVPRRGSNILQQIYWHRIVLDEGHMIRNANTMFAKACFNLEANYRWVLTGTPIVNGVKDMESYYRFLRLEPFFSNSNLFEKKLVKPFLYRNAIAIERVHSIYNTYSIGRKKTEINLGLPNKNEGVVIVPFSNKEEEAYQALRTAMNNIVRNLYDNHGRDQVLRSNYISIRALITRLRQCCLDFRLVPRDALERLLNCFRLRASNRAGSSSSNQPIEKKTELLDKNTRDDILKSLVSYFQAVLERDELPEANTKERELITKGENVTSVSSSSTSSSAFVPCSDESECPICSEVLLPSSTACLTACKHRVCLECLTKWTTKNYRKTCPYCREPFDPICGYTILTELFNAKEKDKEEDDLEKMENEDITVSPDEEYVSSKTKAIIDHVHRIIAEKPDDKIVIFSSFVGYIRILESTFRRIRISFSSILGSVSQKERADIITKFQNNETPKVLFCSLRAAGVGITLHRANHCLLTDLWWNNATDQQAIDRIYRIGQQKQVFITRFLIKGAIDEGILQLQRSKLNQAKSVEKGNCDPEIRKREELSWMKKLIGVTDDMRNSNHNNRRLLDRIHEDEGRGLFEYGTNDQNNDQNNQN